MKTRLLGRRQGAGLDACFVSGLFVGEPHRRAVKKDTRGLQDSMSDADFRDIMNK